MPVCSINQSFCNVNSLPFFASKKGYNKQCKGGCSVQGRCFITLSSLIQSEKARGLTIMKNIILSTDGTGNSGGNNHNTNVWRLHTAVDHQSNKNKQITSYHDGVGSQDNKWLKLVGGVFGWGLACTVKELYIFLVNTYEPDDGLYLFGFSRGAYAVRLLACMIVSYGILDKKNYSSDLDLEHDVDRLYSAFQKDLKAIKNNHNKRMKPTYNAQKELEVNVYTNIRIRFMGVWDTVDAYGIPSDFWVKSILVRCFSSLLYISFRDDDNSLSESIDCACHALSIDDQRRTFDPVLWCEEKETDDHLRINQVWFAGMHANVGGGYAKQGLAWNTLEWMMLEAEKAGLRFVKEDIRQFTENKNVHDKMYDSRSGMGILYSFQPRNISKLWADDVSLDSKPKIHISVFERIALRTERYAPHNFPVDFVIVPRQSPRKRAGVQYNEKQTKALQQQVSRELKQHQQDIKHLSGFSATVHHKLSYFLLGGLLVILVFVIYFFEGLFDIGACMLLFSASYWFFLVHFAKRNKKKIYEKDTMLWRKISSDPVWDFLKP